jgi:predicted DNA-binding protein with PD1-like motif
MRFQQVNDTSWIVRLERGEAVFPTVLKFLNKNAIKGGYISGIGAVESLDLAYYQLETKEYKMQTFEGSLEVASLTGFIAQKENLTTLHLHGVFANGQLEPVAGHLVTATVSGTLELKIVSIPDMHRELEVESGLWVLDLPKKL